MLATSPQGQGQGVSCSHGFYERFEGEDGHRAYPEETAFYFRDLISWRCLAGEFVIRATLELLGFEDGHLPLAVHAVLVRIKVHPQIVHGFAGSKLDAAFGAAQPLAGSFWGRWSVIRTADLYEERRIQKRDDMKRVALMHVEIG